MWRILEGTMGTNLKIDAKRRGRLKAIKAFGTIEFDPKFSYKRARAKRWSCSTLRCCSSIR
jgi:hypothetical protein